MSQAKPGVWKDQIDRRFVTTIADQLKRVYSPFERSAFIKAACDSDFFDLELKDRLDRITHRLKPFLPNNYQQAVKIIVKAAPGLPEFANWALNGYVQHYGLDHFEASIKAMYELTKSGTSEFAIRPYMLKYPDQMMPVLHQWAVDNSEHVRRLAAEGSRPRGVWMAHLDRFKRDPRPVLKLLEKLKADPSKYVQKAVANNLNDISRDNPELAIKTAIKWYKSENRHTRWIVKHACRSLIKQGHPDVFPLFGFTSKPKLELSQLKVSPGKLKIGGDLVFNFVLESCAKSDQRLAIDYRIYFRLASGKLAPKVFKLSESTLKAGASVTIKKKHSFKLATTRRLYPGTHKIEIMINGRACGDVGFELVE